MVQDTPVLESTSHSQQENWVHRLLTQVSQMRSLGTPVAALAATLITLTLSTSVQQGRIVAMPWRVHMWLGLVRWMQAIKQPVKAAAGDGAVSSHGTQHVHRLRGCLWSDDITGSGVHVSAQRGRTTCQVGLRSTAVAARV